MGRFDQIGSIVFEIGCGEILDLGDIVPMSETDRLGKVRLAFKGITLGLLERSSLQAEAGDGPFGESREVVGLGGT